MQKKVLTLSLPKGFTLVELLLVIGIFGLIATISSMSFFSTVKQTDLSAAESILIADLKTKQANAMAGSTDTTWSLATATSLPQGVVLTTSFPGDSITFESGTGEVVAYSPDTDTLTLSASNGSKIIELNQYGTIIGD